MTWSGKIKLVNFCGSSWRLRKKKTLIEFIGKCLVYKGRDVRQTEFLQVMVFWVCCAIVSVYVSACICGQPSPPLSSPHIHPHNLQHIYNTCALYLCLLAWSGAWVRKQGRLAPYRLTQVGIHIAEAFVGWSLLHVMWWKDVHKVMH